MRKFADLVMIPFIIFVLVVLAVLGFKCLLLASTMVTRILVGLGKYAVNEFPIDLASMFSDPIRVIALPIAVGLMIFLGYIGLEYMGRESDNFIRGRQMGKRTTRGSHLGLHRDSHRSSDRPSTRRFEKKSLPRPLTRPNPRSRR